MADQIIKDNAEKEKAIGNALDEIQKRFGRGSIMRLGDDSFSANVQSIPTGSLSLDIATGVGGYPKGRIIEIYGPEASGKTTLALHAIAEAQKQGGYAAFIDAEHALDPIYARNLGVDIDNLLVSQPDTGEQALDIAQTLASSDAIDIIVIDSVAALVPKAEIQGELGDSQIGLQARLISKAMRMLSPTINKSNTCVIFINQLRMKIGVMFGNPEVTTGGNALKYYASMRLDVRKVETLKKGDEMIGSRTRVKIVKNKVSPPFRKAEFDIMYGKGISLAGDILDTATENKIVEKSGSWYSYNGERIGQGRENVKEYLEQYPQLLDEIKQRLLENHADSLKLDTKMDSQTTGIPDDEIIVDDDGVVIEK